VDRKRFKSIMTNSFIAIVAALLLSAFTVGVTFNVTAFYRDKLETENRELKTRIAAFKQEAELVESDLPIQSESEVMTRAEKQVLERRTRQLEEVVSSLTSKLKAANDKQSSSGNTAVKTNDAEVTDVQTSWLDPLDGHKFPAETTGFPTKPLTVADAEMCDPKKQALLSPSWLWCPKDPTCEACAAHWKRNTEVVAAYKTESERVERAQFFKDSFTGVSFNTVVVQAVNFGQIHLWLNWVCSCDANGIKARDFTLLVPADPAAEKVIKDAGFKTVSMKWMDSLSSKIGTVYGGKTNSISTGHSDINNALFMTGQELLHEGFNVLMLDVDFVWMKDPRPFLFEASRGRDVLAMLAPRWDAQGTANTGFVFMRNNFRSKILMDTIVNLMPIKTHSDQLLFNMVLRHYKFRQISFAAVPNVHFPILADNLKSWQKRGGWDGCLTAHVVSSSKEKRLHVTGGIFFNSSCPVYDEELWPCGKDPLNCWAGSKAPKKVL